MSVFHLICGALCVAYYLLIGFYARFGQSLSWLWLAFGGALLLYGLFARRLPPFLKVAFHSIAVLGIALIAFWCVQIIPAMHTTVPANADYLIVLGARVNPDGTPSRALNDRITDAAEYLAANPDTMVIASGGMGDGEPIPEANCIRDGLVALGIDESRVWLEDQSKNTLQNIRNSAEMIEDDSTVVILTNNFHIYRSLRLAKKQGIPNAYGYAAHYHGPTLPHYILRECVALTIWTLRGQL